MRAQSTPVRRTERAAAGLEAAYGQDGAKDSAGAGAETPAEVPPHPNGTERAPDAAPNVGGTTGVRHALVPLCRGREHSFFREKSTSDSIFVENNPFLLPGSDELQAESPSENQLLRVRHQFLRRRPRTG